MNSLFSMWYMYIKCSPLPSSLNKQSFSEYCNAIGGSSSTGHVGPCFSMHAVSSSATVGPKVGDITAPMVTKSSQAASNCATKIVTSSRTTVKVTSFYTPSEL